MRRSVSSYTIRSERVTVDSRQGRQSCGSSLRVRRKPFTGAPNSARDLLTVIKLHANPEACAHNFHPGMA
jgi:hypothetical protein